MKKFLFPVLLGGFLITSCATIISGSKQKIKFDSTPQNATVIIDDVEAGKTPFETKLLKKKGTYRFD